MKSKLKNFLQIANPEIIKNIYEIYKKLDICERAVVGTVSSMISGGFLTILKLLVGVITGSLAFLYGCIYSVGIILCKYLYISNNYAEPKAKKKVYYFIIVVMIITAATFNFLMLIRENTSYVPHRFSPFTTVLFGVLVGIMYYATIKGISQAKQEQNILLIELRTLNLSSLILNLVLLQQMVLGCIGLPTELIKTINMAFGISCGMAMFMIAVSMYIYGRVKWEIYNE